SALLGEFVEQPRNERGQVAARAGRVAAVRAGHVLVGRVRTGEEGAGVGHGSPRSSRIRQITKAAASRTSQIANSTAYAGPAVFSVITRMARLATTWRANRTAEVQRQREVTRESFMIHILIGITTKRARRRPALSRTSLV